MTPGPNPKPLPNVARTLPHICHALASQKPQVANDDVRKFVEAHPKEILLVNVQHFYGYDEAQYKTLSAYLWDALGSKLAKRTGSGIPSLTLSDLWNCGEQILVFFGSDHQVTVSAQPQADVEKFEDRFPNLYAEHPEIWSASEYLNNRWPDSSNLDHLKSKLEGYVNLDGPDDSKFFILQGVITPDAEMYKNAFTGVFPANMEQLGHRVTPKVLSWVNNDWMGQGLNIVMADWVADSSLTQMSFLSNLHSKNSSAN